MRGPDIKGGLVEPIIVLGQLVMSSKKPILDAQVNARWQIAKRLVKMLLKATKDGMCM